MPLPEFEYIAPSSLQEAVKYLDNKNTVALAGGTDLILNLRRRLITPDVVVGLKELSELEGVRFTDENGIVIGALTKLDDIASHQRLKKLYPAVCEAAEVTGTPQVRNKATIGGNICNASPAADNIPSLLSLETEAEIHGKEGKRVLPLENLFSGPGETVLEKGEILTSLKIPSYEDKPGLSYKFISTRGKIDIAAVSAAVSLREEDGACRKANIALGAVSPVPLRAEKAENFMKDKELNVRNFKKAGEYAAEPAAPISDIRASADYRKKMIKVVVKRAFEEAQKRAVN